MTGPVLDESPDQRGIMPGHVEETVRSIQELRADHQRQSTALQRSLDRLMSLFGRPAFAVTLTVLILGWIGVNLTLPSFGIRPLDPPPFQWLQGWATVASLYLVVLVLASQRREDQLEHQRELLGLELAILSEQKTAKVIALLEEFRRDSPHLPDRIDDEAARMAVPSDPGAVLTDIKETAAKLEPQ
jgi:uncharacterized membrane protein